MAVRPVSFITRIRYALETAATYIIYGFFKILPQETASNLGGSILSALGPRFGISAVALKNISAAFPEKTNAEKRDILRGMWDNLGRVIAEYPHLRAIAHHLEIIGREHLIEAAASGKPALLFGGHLANWETAALSAKKAGLPLYVVYRSPNNPGVDGLLRHAREAGVIGHIKKGREGAREIFSLLRQNKAVGIMMDQKLNEGIAIPFFGREAMTATALAQFALKFNCPVYPFRTERLDGTKLRVTVYPPLKINVSGDDRADIKNILTDVNVMLESWIRERPDQWLWLHRRWPES